MEKYYKINRYSYFYTNEKYGLLVNFCNNFKILFSNQEEIVELKKIFNKKNHIEFKNTELIKALLCNGFLIEENIHEEDFIISRYCRGNSDVLELLIYATDDCNFACKYCPQKHVKKFIDSESMNEITDGIINSLRKNKNIKKLVVSWFGGEPMLNIGNILTATEKLKSFCSTNNLLFESGMTTNGYLLSKKLFVEMVNLGIRNYQITIDGNENSHNTTRILKNGVGTWKTIIENLKDISSLDIDYNIIIRLNVSQNNIDQMCDFISYISNNFNEKFSINIMPISQMGNVTSDFHFCGKIESQLVQIYLYKYMIDNNIPTKFLDSIFAPKAFVCNSARTNYFVINSNKEIFKCELNVHDEKNCIGYINKDGIYINEFLNSNYTTPSIKKKCTSCNFFALCEGLSCPLMKINNNDCLIKTDYLIDDYMEVLLYYYGKRISSGI